MAELLVKSLRDHPSALMSVTELAELLKCSPRHIYRLSDRGTMPPPVRIGGLVRWPRRLVEDWIAAGCPPAIRGAGR